MTEKELHVIFTHNIKKYRTGLGLSQYMLAQKAGVSWNFINDLESGKKWASPATMIKIANVFNIHVYELLKPPNLLPDNLNSILEKYTEDVHTALDHINHTLLENKKIRRGDFIDRASEDPKGFSPSSTSRASK